KKTEPKILIKTISLVDSSFHREAVQGPNFEDNLALDREVQLTEDKKLGIVFLTAKLDRKNTQNNNIEVAISVKYVGIFEAESDSDMDLQRFCEINAVAMLYPYIRNHIQETFLKASVSQIILPPINIHTTFPENKSN
ncbi:MAG TPA: protein-export chaperone SecB, partial [Leptospiraceae bacterium]|nr:protein-export chaperone SecB [Leptospiraceae bacterium]